MTPETHEVSFCDMSALHMGHFHTAGHDPGFQISRELGQGLHLRTVAEEHFLGGDAEYP